MNFGEARRLASSHRIELVSYFRVKEQTVLCFRGRLDNVILAIADKNVTQFERNVGLFSREYVVKIKGAPE